MKPGRLRLNYSGTYRLSAPDLTDYRMLNAAQKLDLSVWLDFTPPQT